MRILVPVIAAALLVIVVGLLGRHSAAPVEDPPVFRPAPSPRAARPAPERQERPASQERPATIQPARRAASQVPVELRDLATPEESVVINEIQYRPQGGDRRDQWIEIFNRSKKAADLSNWQFADGVKFTFPPGTELKPGEYLLISPDRERTRQTLGVASVLGNWTGTLKGQGEKLRLVNASGREVESLVYEGQKGFPVLEGDGRSLERRDPGNRADFPGNWGISSTGGWVRFQATGVASSQRLYLYLRSAGTAYLDDLSLRPEGASPEEATGWPPLEGTTAVTTGFEDAEISWSPNGSHAESSISAEQARGGTRSMKLVATGRGSSLSNSVSAELRGIEAGRSYVLEGWALLPEPQLELEIRFSRTRRSAAATPPAEVENEAAAPGQILAVRVTGGAASSPGAANSVFSLKLPPFIFPVSLSPEAPGPTDQVVVAARVTPAGAGEVVLWYDDGGGEKQVPLRDDGEAAQGDAARGDGTFSGRLGPFPANTLVRYRVTARDPAGERGYYPPEGTPARSSAFYIEDSKIRSGIPVYRLFLSPETLAELNQNPDSDAYRPASFVYAGRVYPQVGVRFRGHTSRHIPKHHWKVKFPKEDRFRTPTGQLVKSINLNSFYGDNSYLRETLSYGLWRDLGRPYHETQHVRFYVNGSHQGLYLHLEVPNEDFLERNGLAGGFLWKAYNDGHGGGVGGMEIEAGDPSKGEPALAEFLRNVNRLSGKPLESYLRENLDLDTFIDFLVGCQLTHSADHVQKNYLIYASSGFKFTYLPWDLDLTHGRNYECNGGGIWNEQIRHNHWDDEFSDEKLMFGTRVHTKCDGFWNALIDAVLNRTPAFRTIYYQRLARCLANYYHPEILRPKVERLRELLREEADLDRQRWGGRSRTRSEAFEKGIGVLLRWIDNRYEHLKEKLEALGYPALKPLNACFELPAAAGKVPLKVSFKNLSGGDIQSFLWDFGDGETSTEKEPTHVYRKPGRFDVTLKAKSPDSEHTTRRRLLVEN